MMFHLLILPLLLCQLSFSHTLETESSTLPSHVEPTTDFENLAIVKRGASVMGSGDVKIVSPEELAKDKDTALPKLQRFIDMRKRSVDKLAEKDRRMTIDGRMNIDEERGKRESSVQMAYGEQPTIVKLERKRSAEPDTVSNGSSSSSDSDDSSNSIETIDGVEYNNTTNADSIEDLMNDIEGSGEGIVETTTDGNEPTRTETITPAAETIPWKRPVFSQESKKTKKARKQRDVETEAEQQIETNGDFGDDVITDDDQFEGSGSEYPRTRRQSTTETVLGDETPVMENSLTAQKRPDDRHRPSTPRPDLTCAAVECVRGTQCIIENGRPACKPIISEPQRSCRDINCPRDSRCRMERDSRCRGRDCSEQPVCVREERGATCRNVQCPSGLRCNIVEDPNCRGFRCREIATCTNPCDGVRCPFGTSCKFDGFDALCAPIVINPCLNARCPSGFECRNVQNQAQCFALSTPAATTTPAPSLCAGINEEFASCATFCEPNCAQKNPACVSACAAPRCQCSSGFYRNHQGVCVSEQQCGFPQDVPSCGLNESFNECSSVCEPKCGQPVQLACPAMCGPAKCQCKQGFWRHASGPCVQQNQCFFG